MSFAGLWVVLRRLLFPFLFLLMFLLMK